MLLSPLSQKKRYQENDCQDSVIPLLYTFTRTSLAIFHINETSWLCCICVISFISLSSILWELHKLRLHVDRRIFLLQFMYYIPNSLFNHTFITGSGITTCRLSISMSSFLTNVLFIIVTFADEPSWYFCKTSCLVNSL